MINKLLFHAILTLAHVAGSWCFGAEPPTPSDLIVVYNTGGGINNYLNRGYKDFFAEAEQHAFMGIHNFVHYTKPMQLAQPSWLRTVYPDAPISDFKAFSKYGRQRDKWWFVYLGSPETFKLFPGETDRQWLSRFIDEIRPVIEARPDAIAFDAFQEVDQKRYQLAIDRLKGTYKIDLIFEPARYADAMELADWPVAVQTEFLEQRLGVNGWDTGKNKLRPLVPPSGQPWAIELIRGRDTKAEIANARAHNRVPAVNVGKLGEAE